MKNKTLKVLTISSALLLSSLPTATLAESVSSTKTIQVSEAYATDSSASSQSIQSESSSIDQERLVKRVRELFPNQFSFVEDEEFRIGYRHRSPYDQQPDVEIHNLEFSKRMDNDQHVHGNFEFAGENLELVSYYYRPANMEDALYPPKVSKEEARKLAQAFIEKHAGDSTYKLNDNHDTYYSHTNRPLTEPIEHRFMFNKIVNGIPFNDLSVNVTILGNGQITQYNNQSPLSNPIYESNEDITTKDEALQKLKEQYKVKLKYLIRPNRDNETREVFLTYTPAPPIQGIHAKTGNLNINGKFIETIPAENEIKMLPTVTKERTPLSKDEAKKLAEELLDPKDEDVRLVIEGVTERETPQEGKFYEIRFMHYHGSGGSGSSIRMNKETGELMSFHGYDNYNRFSDDEPVENVSRDEALEKAVSFIQKYAYAHISEYAYPMEEENQYYGRNDVHQFKFPRVKNSLLVEHDYINVSISKEDGSLVSLNKSYTEVDQWPNPENVVEAETALAAYKENLELELMYTNFNHRQKEAKSANKKYDLVYVINQKNRTGFYNAATGEWETVPASPYDQGASDDKVTTTIEHPWAQEELNFMLEAKILTIEDPSSFDPNASLSKGTALEMLSKSLTRVYSYHHPDEVEKSPFENIGTDHELYDVIKRSAELNIIDTSQKTFNVDEKISREQLAYWYIRALKLDEVAKHHDIFKYNLKDQGEITDKYKGYVALANAFGLLTPNQDSEFNPTDEVSYAQMAVSSMRMAKKMTEMNINRY